MEFKRHPGHNNHGGYSFTARSSSNPAPSGFSTFVSSPHVARGFRPNELHNGRVNLVLTQSFKNLLKLHGDLVNERILCLQTLSQHRELLQSRIISFTKELKDDLMDAVRGDMRKCVQPAEETSKSRIDYQETENLQPQESITPGKSALTSKNQVFGQFLMLDTVLERVRNQRQDKEAQILEEIRIYTARERGIMDDMYARERRVEKEFMEFFNDAERQIVDYEKKMRSDSYTQMLPRLRAAERELSYRDQKIQQMEENMNIVTSRCEKLMSELQQVNADHQFEKLQLYHHVEVCKINAKCLVLEEFQRWCKFKRCTCGREYYDPEFLRDAEQHIIGCGGGSGTFPGSSQLDIYQLQRNACREASIVPAGSYIPSEEAATKGIVTNDLRDRYDELQLKATVMPNFEEVRTMIMKIVCHFKMGGLRVCEEIGGKKFVSSLFYCNTEDLIPQKTGKIFATGFGDTPEEATEKSVQKAFDEIQQMETMNVTDKGMEMTFVRRNPMDSKIEMRCNSEPVRMTLLRSFCSDKLAIQPDTMQCLEEAHLYQNRSNAEENYMSDWKIHIRVEDNNFEGIVAKLQHVLTTIREEHVRSFVSTDKI